MRLGPQELLIILAIVIVLFGATRLSGLGKAAGKAIHDFRDEVKGDPEAAPVIPPQTTQPDAASPSPDVR